MNKTVLITGCSSGFGKLTAKKFQSEGWNVTATMRSPEKEQELKKLDNVIVTKLDVTDKSSVKSAVDLTIEKFGAVDALVNNAGYGGLSLFEQFTDEQILAMFETNVFGLMRVTREVMPYMRKQKNGVIINVTSMAGILGLSFASTYSSSKFAVEGFSEALAIECKPFNINVKTVAPGAFGTNFNSATDNSMENGDDQLKEYAGKFANHLAELNKQMVMQSGKEADPQDAADKIYLCATSDTPIHNVVGADAEMLLGMKASLPHQEFLDKMSEMILPKI